MSWSVIVRFEYQEGIRWALVTFSADSALFFFQEMKVSEKPLLLIQRPDCWKFHSNLDE